MDGARRATKGHDTKNGQDREGIDTHGHTDVKGTASSTHTGADTHAQLRDLRWSEQQQLP
jgi:hypothetical protein